MILLAALVTFFMPQAQAEQISCFPREKIAESLLQDYGETPSFRGLSRNGLMIELFLSPQGTWTILALHPENPQMMCPLDSGTGGHKPALKKTGWRI